MTLDVTLWGANGAAADAAGLLSLSRVMACVLWLVLTMIVLASSAVARSVAVRTGASERSAQVAGLLGGGLVLLPMFTAEYVARGFETSLLAVVCLYVMALEVLRGQRHASLLVAGIALVVLAHSWQLVLPGAGLGLAFLLWARFRNAARFERWRTIAVVLIGGLAALPSLVALVRPVGGVGAAHLAVAGDIPRPALVPFAAVVAGVIYLIVATNFGLLPRVVLVMDTVTVLLAFAIARIFGVEVGSYYPNKVLWVGVVAMVPLGGVALAGMLRALDRSGRWRVPFVLVGAAAGVAVAAGVVSVASAPLGVWSTVDGDDVARAFRAPGAGDADVFWTQSSGPMGNTVQIMLRFFDPGARDEKLPTGSVSEQCEVLIASPNPTVLTTSDPASVRQRFSCAPVLRVVRVAD